MNVYEVPQVETIEIEVKSPIAATSECPLETEDVHVCEDDEA